MRLYVCYRQVTEAAEFCLAYLHQARLDAGEHIPCAVMDAVFRALDHRIRLEPGADATLLRSALDDAVDDVGKRNDTVLSV